MADALAAGRAGRRLKLAAAALAIATLAGAAIGAALAPPPKDEYRAEALIDLRPIAPRNPTLAAAETATIGTLLRSAQARREVSPLLAGTSAGQVQIVLDPRAATVRIETLAESAVDTTLMANSYLSAAIDFLHSEQVRGLGTIALGDFEQGLDGWQIPPSLFITANAQAQRIATAARFGRASLRVECAAVGCGAFRRIFYPFRAGIEYRFTGWVHADSARAASIVAIAGTSADQVHSAPLTPGSTWQQLTLAWMPHAATLSAEFALRDGTSPSSFLVDGATFTDASVAAPPRPDAAVFAQPQPAPLVYPADTAAARHGNAATSAAVGAGVGLVAGAVGLACALAAARQRRRQGQPE